MRQRLTSIILILTLTASVIAGAISVSINIANSDASDSDVGIFSQLIEEARLDCPVNRLSEFRSITDDMYNNFSNYLIIVITDDASDSWYFVAYAPRNNYQLIRWSNQAEYSTGQNQFYRFRGIYNNNGNTSVYGMQRVSVIKMTGGNYIQYSSTNTYIEYATIRTDINWTDTSLNYGLSPTICNVEGRKAYSNQDIYYLTATNTWDIYWNTNLYPDPLVPDPIEYSWFKFNLGDRWYITTYDQSLVNMMPTGDDTFWVWSFDVYRYDSDDPSVLTLFSSDMQYISYAENFISQNLTNVSSSGVYCYDVTDYINSAEYIFFAQATFYQVLDYPGGMVLGDVMAESDDVVYMSLSAQEEDPARNEAWTIINNYFENYPTVTIVPDQLASQLAGITAYTSGTGYLSIPDQLQLYAGIQQSYSGEFRYDLSQSGLDPDELSMLNFDLFNVVIVPGRIDVDYFNLEYWDSSVVPTLSNWSGVDRYTISQKLIDQFNYTNDLYESFDLVIFAPLSVFQDTGTPFDGTKARSVGYIGDIGRYDSIDSAYRTPMFWIVTKSAIQKSQLYAFCDGFGKLYKLASEYVQKKDLWDNSFFEWSMSIFYQLESLNGHLSAIKTSIQSIDSKIDTMIQNLQDLNTDPTEDTIEPWYLSLWNFVRQFNPSNDQVSTGINALSDNLEDLPALPAPSAAPALPTFAP